MRILLIKPPIRACMVEIGRHMPIGLAYLAASLRRSGHAVTIFDALAFVDDNHIVDSKSYTAADKAKIEAHPRWNHLVHWGASWDRIAAELRRSDADIVGISCMFTPYYEPAYELARLARQTLPNATILLGGQHPTVAHPHALTERAFDVLVLGEAESTIVDIVGQLEAGQALTGVHGVAFRCGGGYCECQQQADRIHVTPRAGWIENLDEVPRPAVDLLDMSAYDNTATLITSRGCPFSCSFCTVHATVGKRFRARSPADVAGEISDYVHHHGIRRFFIEDDNFTFDIPRVRQICAEIRRLELDVELHLPNGMTVVKLTDELAEDMAGAGFRSLFLGLESTDVKRLRAMRKGFTSLSKVQSGAASFSARNVTVGASLIVGLLGQDVPEIADDSVQMARSGVRFWTNPFYPIPGSGDFNSCVAAGLIGPDTELALYDQFNFAIGSDRVRPDQLYWAWVATQAIAQWPAYVLAGGGMGGDYSLSAAAEDLVAASAHLLNAPLEVPAVPVALSGKTVAVHADGCFCAMQQLAAMPSRPPDLCRFTGDVIAAALSLRSGVPVGAEPAPS